MTQQFNRNIELRIIGKTDTLVVNKGLALSFSCEKDRSSTPNGLTIEILNLSEGTRNFIRANGRIELYAGYGESLDLLARMDVQKSITRYNPPDTITEITCLDGMTALRDKEIKLSFKGKATVGQAVARIVAQMGITSRQIDIDLNVPMEAGYTHAGKATEALDDVLSLVKGVWGIVNNVLIITTRGKGIGNVNLTISPQNGLLGQPSITEDTFTYERILHLKKDKKKRVKKPKAITKKEAKKKGIKWVRAKKTPPIYKIVQVDVEKTESVKETVEGVEMEMLLRPNVNPFDKIRLESRFINGVFVVDKVTHDGSTRDGSHVTRVTAYREASA
jgi:hypothetical protein